MIAEITNNLVEYISKGEFSLVFLLVSFLGGVLASVSPCSLGVLPLVIGYVGGYSDNNKLKTFIQLCSFVLGLGVVLTAIGIICALTGRVFSSFGGVYFIIFLASLILVLGLNLLGVIDINFSPLIKKMPKNDKAGLFLYPFLIGMIFALSSSPCSTPILAGIMSFAVLTKNILLAGLMLFLFSIGQGVIIILAGIFTTFLKGIKNAVNISEALMKISGVLLVLSAIVIYVKMFMRFF
ncbi:MAG: hypothetical protein IJ877_04800 [Candidatus Gastranaerophilales bacterium]|nr:hypothetical protein [Candidatus Gastranaerophilales bacterium]